MAGKRPPFRADHVGSLLRPAELIEARRQHAAGRLDAAELRAAEDRAIADLIRKQERIGLSVVTDGEFRRAAWHWGFLGGLAGVHTALVPTVGDDPARVKVDKVAGRIDFPADHPMLAHFAFLRAHTHATAKMTIPSPAMLVSALHDWRAIVDARVYPDIEEFYHDLGQTYAKAVRAFADLGCTYLQFDDCNLAYLCDPKWRHEMTQRGDDPDTLLARWISVINTALAARPTGMTVATHICRGNFRSRWFAQGGYEPIADALLNRLDFDIYFLEYDSDRAGGFEPLRFLSKNGDKTVVLGLVTTKTGALESKDGIKARIEEATRYAAIDDLALSPQCGFASTEHGNALSEQEEWRKLALVREIADEVWSS